MSTIKSFVVKEIVIEKRVCDFVFYNLGIENVKFEVKGKDGYSDRMFFIPGGKPFIIEFKRPNEDPRALQSYRIEKLINLGYDVEVHTNEAEAIEAIIRRLEASQIPEEGREALVKAKEQCSLLRSRIG